MINIRKKSPCDSRERADSMWTFFQHILGEEADLETEKQLSLQRVGNVGSLQEQKHRPTPTSAATANIKAQVSVYLIICSANSSVEWTTTPLKNNILRDFDFLPCECGNVNFFFFLVLLEQWSV